jgi:hypothetical protein
MGNQYVGDIELGMHIPFSTVFGVIMLVSIACLISAVLTEATEFVYNSFAKKEKK